MKFVVGKSIKIVGFTKCIIEKKNKKKSEKVGSNRDQ